MYRTAEKRITAAGVGCRDNQENEGSWTNWDADQEHPFYGKFILVFDQENPLMAVDLFHAIFFSVFVSLLDIAAAETKEDLLVLLTNVSQQFDHYDQAGHDHAVKEGTVTKLAQILHGRLVTTRTTSNTSVRLQLGARGRDRNPSNSSHNGDSQRTASAFGNNSAEYRTRLNSSQTLQTAVICSTLATILLRCSDTALFEYCHQFKNKLTTSLPRAIHAFVALEVFDSQHVIRLVTLNNVIRIMKRLFAVAVSKNGAGDDNNRVGASVAVVGQRRDRTIEFVDAALLLLVSGNIPPDIRLEAACAIPPFMMNSRPIKKSRSRMTSCNVVTRNSSHHEDQKDNSDNDARSCSIRDDCTDLIIQREASSPLISILSTAATDISKENLNEIFQAIERLSKVSVLCAKMAKRRCMILAITKQLFHRDHSIRKRALNILESFLEHHFQGMKLASTAVFESNLDLITNELVRASVKESVPKLQVLLIRCLDKLTNKKGLDQSQLFKIMKSLYIIASRGDTADSPAIDSALSYLRAAPKVTHSQKFMSNVASLITSPYAKVRSMALQLMIDIPLWNPQAIMSCLIENATLDSFALIIQHGPDDDCRDVFRLCKQIVSYDRAHHRAMCTHPGGILRSIVRFVTKEPVTNRTAYMISIDVILELLSNKANIPSFLPLVELLPWLVSLANMTSNETLKTRLVSATIALSSAMIGTN